MAALVGRLSDERAGSRARDAPRLRSGERIGVAVAALRGVGVSAVLANCAPPARMPGPMSSTRLRPTWASAMPTSPAIDATKLASPRAPSAPIA